ncbi:RNA-binding S4 domain-containing protein [Cynara cardunculus var. scolymus]|uniref:RNA-binding S4 domain-containing protein n=1 Tax=Cynara cardunculus var. scolymus TaxID=59895 RepID=A0A103Y4A3_CYNCS|nr:RNA-binding S4 domain-containing protein [Cynara cardunculus var. scolymus]
MGIDGVESELAHVAVENGKKEIGLNGHVDENESGTHGNESVRVETTPDTSFPKDAVDEWPEAKVFHSVYFVKYRTVEDQNLKAKLDLADKELRKLNQARDPITEKLRAKRTERAQVIGQLKALVEEKNHFRTIMDDKRKEIEPLQQALGKLRGPRDANRDNRSFICSSEGELNDVIKSLQYRIQHESITLNEEKQIIREIKQFEGTRDKVIANAAMRAEVQKSVGEKDAIQDQVKLIGVGLDGVRKDQQAIKAKVKTLEAEKEAINSVIASLEEELHGLVEKRDKVYEKIRELRNKREEGNSCFYQNRSLLNDARRLAANKDSKAFREDYEKRILQSLDIRQLTKDGRMRNPGEKPLISQEIPTPVPVEIEVVAKPKVKQTKEEPAPPPVAIIEEEKDGKNAKETNGTVKGKKEKKEEEEVFRVEKKPTKTKEVDESKLKEIKREEEIAKAKQALERKKKLAEKAAAKAQKKAEKEAEKKLKEITLDREKKEKKKMQASAPAADPEEATTEEAAAEAPEEEKIEENVKITAKKSFPKENTRVRSRNVRGKGPESISKVILKRKKSNNYMYYYAAAASAIVVVILAIGQTENSIYDGLEEKKGFKIITVRRTNNNPAATRHRRPTAMASMSFAAVVQPLLKRAVQAIPNSSFTIVNHKFPPSLFHAPLISSGITIGICHLAQAVKGDNEILLKGVGEKGYNEEAKRASLRREVLHTDFLTPPVVKESMMIIEKLADVKTLVQGGYPEAERCRLSVGHPEALTTEPDIGEKGAHVLVIPELVDFLTISLDKMPLIALEYEPPRTKTFKTVEASMRIDSIASAGFKISRSKLVGLISDGDVRVNWVTVTKNNTTIRSGDMISIGEVNETKKGKFAVELIRFL